MGTRRLPGWVRRGGNLLLAISFAAMTMLGMAMPGYAQGGAAPAWSAVGQQAPGIPDSVLAVASDVYVGGASGNVWWWNGSTWTELGTLASSDGGNGVTALDSVSGTVYAGTLAGTVWAWNGTAWSELPQLLGVSDVTAMTTVAGQVYIGWVNTVGVYAWNGASLTPVGSPSTPYGTSSLLTVGQQVYAGEVGTYVNQIWWWNGATWSQVDTGNLSNNAPQSLAMVAGQVYAGGSAGGVWGWNGTAWGELGSEPTGLTGKPVTGLVPGSVAGTVYAGTAGDGVWYYDGNSWSLVGSPQCNGPAARVVGLSEGGAGLYAATQAGLMLWNGSAWVPQLAPGELPTSTSEVVLPENGVVYAGTQGSGVWSWNGTGWSPLGTLPGCHMQSVNALTTSSDGLLAGTDGESRDAVQAWNGTVWSTLGTGFPQFAAASVLSFTTVGGWVYAGTQGDGVWGLNAQGGGTAWSQVGAASWSSGPGAAPANALVSVDGAVYAAVGSPAGEVWFWNGAAWSKAGSLGSQASALAVWNGQVYAGTPNGGVYAWDPANGAWGHLAGLDAAVGSDDVLSLAVVDDQLLAGAGGVAVWNGAGWVQVGGSSAGARQASPHSLAAWNGTLYEGGANSVWSLALPQFTSLSPTSGAAGTTLTATGTGFGSVPGAVYFYQASAPANPPVVQPGSAASWSDTSLSVTVPNTVPPGLVYVRVYDTQSGLLSNHQAFTMGQPIPSGGSITFAPNPVATAGTLSAGTSVTVLATIDDSSGDPVPWAEVWASFTPAAGDNATAAVNGTSLGSTPTMVLADGSGQLNLTYTAANPLPSSGVDTITLGNAASSPTISASDSYSYQTTAPPTVGVAVSASPASILANGTSTSTISATVTVNGAAAPAGTTVDFSTTAGTLASASATTNASGVATDTLTSSTTPGTATVTATASVSGVSASGTASVSFASYETSSGSTSSASTPAAAGGTGTATPDTTATASGGTGSVYTAVYAANPTSATPVGTTGTYVDVSLSPGSSFTQVVVEQCGVASGDSLNWWNGTAWSAVSPAATFSNGCLSVTLNSGTSPNLSQLTGTPFAVVSPVSPVSSGGGVAVSQAPTVSGVSPASGPAAGGTSVTVSGTGFTGATAVDFGTTPAASFTVVSDSEITAVSPAGTGTVDVTVTTSSGTSATSSADQFTYTAVTPPAPPTFTDVSSSFWAASAIELLAGKGIVAGFPDGTFRPNAVVTRAQFVTMLVKAAGLTPVASGQTPFSDVPPGQWYAPYVAAAYQAGLVSGMGNGTFDPNGQLTRAQLAVLLAKAVGTSATSSLSRFSDAAAIPSWAEGSVETVVADGLMAGFPNGTFGPDQTATRAQAAAVLAAYLKQQGKA